MTTTLSSASLPQETVLSTIPGASEDQRLLVVLTFCDTEGSFVEIRQQTWGDGIGWYTQSSMKLSPLQVAQLRNSLGVSKPSEKNASLPSSYSRLPAVVPFPRVAQVGTAG